MNREEAKQIAQFVLRELKKSSYPITTDNKLDFRKTGMGRAKGGTLGPIGLEYQHYSSDIAWTAVDDDEVSWTSGTVRLADGRNQSISSGGAVLSGAGLNYFWMVVGNTTIQTSTNYYDGVGVNKALLAFATKAPVNDQSALIYPFFGTEPTFNSDVLSANMILATHIKAGVITATHIQASSITADRLSFAAFDKGSDDLDDVSDGSTYGKLNNLDMDSHHIKLTSSTVWSGKVTVRAGITIDSSTGINIWGVGNALTTRATESGTIQCYVGADGAMYAGAGSVKLDVDGLMTIGSSSSLKIRYVVDQNLGNIYTPASNMLYITSAAQMAIVASTGMQLSVTGSSLHLYGTGGTYFDGGVHSFQPYIASTMSVGTSVNKFYAGYFDNLPSCPEGLPTQAHGLDVLKKVKEPTKVIKGVLRFVDDDFPDELKINSTHLDKDGNVVKDTTTEVEYIKTIGMLVQAMRELTDKVEKLEKRLDN